MSNQVINIKIKANESQQLPYFNLIQGSKKIQSISSSASHSNALISNSNCNHSGTSSSFEDDDECFYDAIDAADNDFYTIINKLNKKPNNGSEEEQVDDCKLYFYDTYSCKDSYESDIQKIEPSETVNSFKEIEANIGEVGGVDEINESDIDEEDCEDAELETPWSFWIDQSIRGTTKNEYEAGLKLIHTVDTVQVCIIIR